HDRKYLSVILSLTVLRYQTSTPVPYTTLFRSLVFAALFHDVAKPVTARVDETGRIRFNEHDRVGAEITEAIMRTRSCSLKRMRRSEEHTSELLSRFDLVCRLLLAKKNNFISEE